MTGRHRERVKALLPAMLRALADHRGLTQAEICRRIGLLPKNTGSRSSVNGWFTGARVPGPAEVRALATVLDIKPDAIFSLQTLAGLQERRLSAVTTALGTWPQMLTGHDHTLLLGGATMFPAIVQLLGTDLRGTTVLVSTLSTELLTEAERRLNGARRETAFLRASWLAMADVLLDLAAAKRGPRVRLWVRDVLPVGPSIAGSHVVANDWMMIEAQGPESEKFRVSVFGDRSWPGVATLIDDLSELDELPGSRVCLDSAWRPDDPRRKQFSRYCAGIGKEVMHSLR